MTSEHKIFPIKLYIYIFLILKCKKLKISIIPYFKAIETSFTLLKFRGVLFRVQGCWANSSHRFTFGFSTEQYILLCVLQFASEKSALNTTCHNVWDPFMKWAAGADLLHTCSDSTDKGLSGYGCYDSVVARIIPRITSKTVTQIIMNTIFAALAERHMH